MGGCSSTENASTFKRIRDKFETFDELQKAWRREGLESSNLMIGIDYTKSNTWTGERSFKGRCLHDVDPSGFIQNPYQQVISIVGKTLEDFDDDHLIPAFGFGDSSTGGTGCFPFLPDRKICTGFQQVLQRYNEITPQLVLAGPTNFGPLIREAIQIVKVLKSYHILVIIADGQVTNERDTANAIVEASNYPLSIIMVGVGDGPWNMMNDFDDNLPTRKFDNFQFVEFNRTMKMNVKNPQVGFATDAMMEIPEQYQYIRKHGLLNSI